MSKAAGTSKLQIQAVRATDWPALEALFGSNGACGGCWCMYWRSESKKAFDAQKGEKARASFKALVESGQVKGMLAFEGEQAVGWCAYGERAEFPLTETKRSYRVDDPDVVTSVNCFFIHKAHRGAGVAKALLEAVVAQTRVDGGAVLEGYPSVVAPGSRQAAAFLYKGTLGMFERAGFQIVQRTSAGSPLVRRRVALQGEHQSQGRSQGDVVSRRAS